MQPLLVVATVGDTVALYAPRTRVSIGRSAQCELEVQDPNVSRRHAELGADGDTVWVRDLGSSNGTFVNGQRIGADPVQLTPGVSLAVGQTPLTLDWGAAREPSQNTMVHAPLVQQASFAPAPTSVGLGGSSAPNPAQFPYRSQGANNNGVFLIALRQDTFANGEVLDGYVEYTAMDDETIDHIFIELVEHHADGARKGHVWDRMLIKQGPWKTQKGDVVPMPFSLRVPPGTSPSGRRVHWEIRGYVDIAWGSDIEAKSEIRMRNKDIERLRDALGHLDFRLAELDPAPLGQSFKGVFHPPANRVKQFGVTDVNISVQYLGTNLEVEFEVEKASWFRFDRATKAVFDLNQLRTAPVSEIAAHFDRTIDALMAS
ncbi:MAG: FHA domain-containing protein [Myxococcales bacterium]|nr:FHA domain-containing protein [Myxococcales bacterium]